MHETAQEAVIADIGAALGRVGDEGGLTKGVAKLVLDKRRQIEKAFADLDSLLAQQPEIDVSVEGPNVHHLPAKEG